MKVVIRKGRTHQHRNFDFGELDSFRLPEVVIGWMTDGKLGRETAFHLEEVLDRAVDGVLDLGGPPERRKAQLPKPAGCEEIVIRIREPLPRTDSLQG